MRKNYPFYKNEPVDSIVELIERSKRLYGDSVAIKYKKKRRLYEKTYNDLFNNSKKTAAFLLNQQLCKGHIAVLGASSYEWIISYLGAIFAGMVVVPIDKELNANEIAELLSQSDADCLLYDEKYLNTVNDIQKKYHKNILNFSFDEMVLLSTEHCALPPVQPDNLSAILFTSGTTGKSKGVMLTQKNIAGNVIQGVGAVNLKHNKDVIMSVLPFNHAYEFTCTVLGMIYKGVPICISSGLKYMQKELTEYQPTVMFVVPIFAETLYKTVESSVKKQNRGNSSVKLLKYQIFLKRYILTLPIYYLMR